MNVRISITLPQSSTTHITRVNSVVYPSVRVTEKDDISAVIVAVVEGTPARTRQPHTRQRNPDT